LDIGGIDIEKEGRENKYIEIQGKNPAISTPEDLQKKIGEVIEERER